VYGSNRGHNSIVVFSRDPRTGILNPIQYAPVEGNWPRNFTLTPDGGYLLVANQKSNNITIFKIDKTSGKITYTGNRFSFWPGLPEVFKLRFRQNTKNRRGFYREA
jgi:6-phosphogluconolactonase